MDWDTGLIHVKLHSVYSKYEDESVWLPEETNPVLYLYLLVSYLLLIRDLIGWKRRKETEENWGFSC